MVRRVRGGRARARRSHGYRPGEDAFTLVTLMILVTVMNIVVAAALPLWSQQIRREQEEELIFRGLQYAEAIRVFQQKHDRLPLRLQELVELEPRSIRQLWLDPVTGDGTWGLILGDVGGQVNPNQSLNQGRRAGLGDDDELNDATPTEDVTDARNGRARLSPRAGDTVTTGPIRGVHSLSDDASIKVFAGGQKHNEWLFTVDLIPIAPTGAGEVMPSLSGKWVGRPLPQGLEPQGGSGIEDEFGDEEDNTSDPSGRDRRDRRRNRTGG